MNTFDPAPPLTDEELDAVLGSASRDLLGRVRTATDPAELFLALMDRDGDDRPAPPPLDRAAPGPGAVNAIIQRRLARDLTDHLTCACAFARTITETPLPDGDLHIYMRLALRRTDSADRLARGIDRDRVPGGELAHEIARGRALARRVARTHDTARLRARARDLVHALVRAGELARAFARVLDDAAIDASGADLSRLELGPGDVALLAGVVWTGATRWPPRISQLLARRSLEIGPGVYRVQPGGERAPLPRGDS
ncbi:hypothetical protein HUT17_04985 (plasmid) [Nocardiopsis flavescens]|nr:hypothetical protein HUT17_04985 [Nocardiopsis flavescens]